MKRCNKCGIEKPLDEFHKASKSPDGRQYRCKTCSIAAARQRAKDNPEAARKADQKYRQTDKYKATRKARREGPQREKILEQKRSSWERHAVEYAERVRAARQKEPERFGGYYQRNYAANKEQILEKNRAWADANREKVRGYKRQWAYGITPEEFDRKLLEQDGRCEICSVELHLVVHHNKDGSVRSSGICVDHCHSTGAVRGLICSGCNKGLGYFKDDPVRLRAAAEYLEKHQQSA